MIYKEKYEMALERARTIYNDSYKPDKALVIAEVLSHIFPELKENEDERIRKGIMALVEQSAEILSGSNQKRMLAWLEKQGEQKSTDNADTDTNWKEGDVIRHGGVLADSDCKAATEEMSPKSNFKVGDWVVCDKTTGVLRISQIECNGSVYICIDHVSGALYKCYAKDCRPWTIQEAKKQVMNGLTKLCLKRLANG